MYFEHEGQIIQKDEWKYFDKNSLPLNISLNVDDFIERVGYLDGSSRSSSDLDSFSSPTERFNILIKSVNSDEPFFNQSLIIRNTPWGHKSSISLSNEEIQDNITIEIEGKNFGGLSKFKYVAELWETNPSEMITYNISPEPFTLDYGKSKTENLTILTGSRLDRNKKYEIRITMIKDQKYVKNGVFSYEGLGWIWIYGDPLTVHDLF